MMVSQGLQIALDLLFIAAGLLAIGSMIVTWHSVAPRVMELRGDLARLNEMREFRAAVISTVVRPDPRAARISYRPARSLQWPERSLNQDALRAAA